MIALLLALATAVAAPCATADGMPVGPVTVPVRDGGLSTPRRLCPRSEFAASIDGRATIDTANFYGYLVGGLALDGSVALGDVEVFGRLEAIRFDMAVASLTSTNLGLGPLQLGVTWAPTLSKTLTAGVRLRTFLPTYTGLYRNARPLAFDLALASSWSPNGWLTLHDEVGGLAHFTLGRGGTVARAGAWANVGLETRLHRVFGLVIDVDAAFGLYAPLDHLEAGLGLRFSDGKRFGFELAGRVPVAGRTPELALVALRFSARLGAVGPGVAALGREAPRHPDADLAPAP